MTAGIPGAEGGMVESRETVCGEVGAVRPIVAEVSGMGAFSPVGPGADADKAMEMNKVKKEEDGGIDGDLLSGDVFESTSFAFLQHPFPSSLTSPSSIFAAFQFTGTTPPSF